MVKQIIKTRRDIPSVEILVSDKAITAASKNIARPLTVEIVKQVIESLKAGIDCGKISLPYSGLKKDIIKEINRVALKKIDRVINGTGILVHTNLGRAPLSEDLFDSIKSQITGYGNVEFDIYSGKRGKRGELAEKYLSLAAGTEAGTVVNNNAAALFLILNTFANRKKVIISRGELVQIGGGFRIPDIIKKSGAKMIEIGTTNITTLDDYKAALNENPTMILKVHKSNYSIGGFTGEANIRELAVLGKKNDIMVVNDLGSGVFVDTVDFTGEHEPTVQNSVRDGADITCFSGDKLLGGIQAGLIAGTRKYISKIKKNPLFRTMRVDKTVFSALEKLLGYYLDGTWSKKIKLWQLASRKEADLYKMGRKLLKKIDGGDKIVLEGSQGRMGGGSLPEVALPSAALVFISEKSPESIARLFRENTPPIVGRITDEHFLIDLKAIDEADLDLLADVIKTQLTKL